MHYDHEETNRHIKDAGNGSYLKGALIIFSPFIMIGVWTMIVLTFGR